MAEKYVITKRKLLHLQSRTQKRQSKKGCLELEVANMLKKEIKTQSPKTQKKKRGGLDEQGNNKILSQTAGKNDRQKFTIMTRGKGKKIKQGSSKGGGERRDKGAHNYQEQRTEERRNEKKVRSRRGSLGLGRLGSNTKSITGEG